MNDLRDRLQQAGLSQYFEAFATEGFDSWATILDITESDLSHLNVKLGHRRKLQRAIAEYRGQSADRPLPITLNKVTSAEGSYRSDDSATEGMMRRAEPSTIGAAGTSTKRKYRRHPKPDEHAPERPPSAYVIFSNQVRESLKGQDLSFTEIAKVVGEKWQILPVEERESCESQANSAKERYYAELAEYKKTPQYAAYQQYLEDFRAKHAGPTKGKRSRLQTERSTSSRNNSYELGERAAGRRLSSTQPEISPAGHHHQEPTPPAGVSRLPKGSLSFSKPTSPVAQSISGFNSPRTDERQYSPTATPPRSVNILKELVIDATSGIPARDPRALPDVNPLSLSSSYTHPPHHAASATSPPHTYGSHYPSSNNPVAHPRRPIQEASRLPPLSHDDTTWSSESGHGGYGFPLVAYPGPILPVDPVKSLRMLPQPVPNIGPVSSPLDRLPLVTSPLNQPQQHDYRTQGSLAVLLRAGELAARAADAEDSKKEFP